MPRFDGARALALIERHRVDWMYAVPTMMHRIWRLPEGERTRFDLSSLRVVFHMAAPCPMWLKEAWIGWLGGDRVLELYGGTEAQSITVISGNEWLEHRGSVGRVILGEMVVLDPDGRELPPGQVGEIWMRRGADAPASYRYVGAIAKSRPGNWESLGDMGRVDEEGYIYLSDRDTDMILVGGANVYPAEVEAALDEQKLAQGRESEQRETAFAERERPDEPVPRGVPPGGQCRFDVGGAFAPGHQRVEDLTGDEGRRSLEGGAGIEHRGNVGRADAQLATDGGTWHARDLSGRERGRTRDQVRHKDRHQQSQNGSDASRRRCGHQWFYTWNPLFVPLVSTTEYVDGQVQNLLTFSDGGGG